MSVLHVVSTFNEGKTMNRIIVVGDIFNVPVSMSECILNESDAIEKIVSLRPVELNIELIVEQGVDMLALTRAIEYRRAAVGVEEVGYVLRPRDSLPRAVRRLAHKARTENICVSYPRRLSETEFELDLQFSAQNEFFLDHMTGFHIQGMALTEAARQAFLAVTEEFFLQESKDQSYFVIRRQNVSFDSFVFPFGTTIRYRIVDHQVKSGRQSFEVVMELVQADVVCSRVDVAFTTFSAAHISAREEELISQRARDIVSGFAPGENREAILGAA